MKIKTFLWWKSPPGFRWRPAASAVKDMVSLLKNHLAETGGKPGGIPYLGMIHRLDQPVQGVMVFAKNQKAAAFPEQRNRSERDEKDLPRRRGRNRERRGIAHRLSLKGRPHQHFQKGSQRNQRREGVPALLRMPENTGRSGSRRPPPLPRPDSIFSPAAITRSASRWQTSASPSTATGNTIPLPKGPLWPSVPSSSPFDIRQLEKA